MNKPTKTVRTPDMNEQILRAIAMKRESYFQLILANLLQNASVTDGLEAVGPVVAKALNGADQAIELLYPVKPEE